MSEITREIYPTRWQQGGYAHQPCGPKNSIYSFFAALWIIRLPCLVRLCPAWCWANGTLRTWTRILQNHTPRSLLRSQWTIS